MKKHFIKGLCLIALLGTLGACTQPELPQDSYYRLSVTPPGPQPVKLKGILEVERFRADGLLSGRPIAFSEGKGRLSEYHYHFWIEPPVDLLQESMVKYLRGANLAVHIVTPELRVSEDFLLTGKIKRLERDLSNGDKVAVEIEIGLVRRSDDKILVLKTYSRQLPQSSGGVHGAVQAMNDALADIYAEFLRDASAAS